MLAVCEEVWCSVINKSSGPLSRSSRTHRCIRSFTIKPSQRTDWCKACEAFWAIIIFLVDKKQISFELRVRTDFATWQLMGIILTALTDEPCSNPSVRASDDPSIEVMFAQVLPHNLYFITGHRMCLLQQTFLLVSSRCALLGRHMLIMPFNCSTIFLHTHPFIAPNILEGSLWVYLSF